jgi:hypothetical protein
MEKSHRNRIRNVIDCITQIFELITTEGDVQAVDFEEARLWDIHVAEFDFSLDVVGVNLDVSYGYECWQLFLL